MYQFLLSCCPVCCCAAVAGPRNVLWWRQLYKSCPSACRCPPCHAVQLQRVHRYSRRHCLSQCTPATSVFPADPRPPTAVP